MQYFQRFRVFYVYGYTRNKNTKALNKLNQFFLFKKSSSFRNDVRCFHGFMD